MAARILAEVDDIHRFPSERSWRPIAALRPWTPAAGDSNATV
jgi:hypothetical protein